MDKIMNLYNPVAGSKVPIMLGDVNYIVLTSFKCTKQPTERVILAGESPKAHNRRSIAEFGIARRTEVLGRRRAHITTGTCGKELSLSTLKIPMPKGIGYQEELKILKLNLDKGEKVKNLSRIQKVR